MESDNDLNEFVLNAFQRRLRALNMRKIKTRLEIGRERAENKMADLSHLKKRARKEAIQTIRRKVAGTKGAEYDTLTVGEKMNIDKRVQQRIGLIAKLAIKLLPSVRRSEMERLAGRYLSHQKSNVNEAFEEFIEGTIDYDKREIIEPSTKKDKWFNRYLKDRDNNLPLDGNVQIQTLATKFDQQDESIELVNKAFSMLMNEKFENLLTDK